MIKFVVFETSLNGFFMNRDTPSKLTEKHDFSEILEFCWCARGRSAKYPCLPYHFQKEFDKVTA